MRQPHPFGNRRRDKWRGRGLAPWFVGAGLALALVAQGSTASPEADDIETATAATGCAVTARLVPTCGKTLAGVYARPTGAQSHPGAVRAFERTTGTPTQIVHY